jgi:uncharacterized protein
MDMDLRFSLDQVMHIVISEDKLTAKLQFINEHPDFECSISDIETFIKHNGIKYGIQYEVLAKIAKESNKLVYNQVTIATGIAPIEGRHGYIKYLFEKELDTKPLELDDGTVNFKEVNVLNNAKKGQLIAERIPATEGQEGIAVTGEPLPCKHGKEARFKIGKNVVVDQEQLRMYAAIDGLITRTEKEKINVFPVYEVNGDVDYSIGNIDFVGTVVIRGNVLPGFRVKATGDIRIIGGVEAAEIISEGSIEITAGILGHNKGLVQAKRNVKSSFIQEGNVEAGEDVIVSQSILHSNIRGGRNVICYGSKGLIVGGTIQAGERVKARNIGNTTSMVTVIEVGVLPVLRNELNDYRVKLRDLLENADKTDKALVLLDQLAIAGQLSPDKLAMRTRLATTKKQLTDEIEGIRIRVLEIEKSLEDTTVATVEVSDTIYSGCKIVIGRYTRFIKDSTKHVIFRMVEGEVAIQSKM